MNPTTTLTLDRTEYAPGDTVEATLELHNVADTVVVLAFFTSQRYDLVLRDASGAEVWRWSNDRGFAQVLGEERLEPGDSRTWRERFAAPETAGSYTLEALVTTSDSTLEASTELTVRE